MRIEPVLGIPPCCCVGAPPAALAAELRREPGALLVSPEQAAALADAGFALLEGKQQPGAYRCEGFVCALPQRF